MGLCSSQWVVMGTTRFCSQSKVQSSSKVGRLGSALSCRVSGGLANVGIV